MTERPTRPPTWSAGGRSFMGAAHLQHGMPNQDAIAWAPRATAGAAAVLAVADGHGAAVHFRSGIGAHLAVEVAAAVLQDAVTEAGWIAANDMRRATGVAHEVVRRWRTAVLAHRAADPLHSPANDAAALLPYGATLLAAAATPEGVFVMQIGDGDLVLAAADGALLRPLPDDTGMIGEQTYSLCQENAEQYLRLRIIPRAECDVDLVLLATDGVAKSFNPPNAAEIVAAAWRASIAREDWPAVLRRLDAWLPDVSRRGSGDDTTLGFLVRSDLAERPAPAEPEWPHPVPRTAVRALPPQPVRGIRLTWTWAVGLAGGLLSAATAVGMYWLR